jgi:hypothetical protein
MPTERLILFCEGQTEETFSNLVLEPYFRSLGVADVKPILLPNRPGATARRNKGGWVSYAKAKQFIVRFMRVQHKPRTWFSTLFDLYAIPEGFPGLAEAPRQPADQKVRYLEQCFKEDIVTDHLHRFTPHLQLHEFEALLLSDCAAIGSAFPDNENGVASLTADIGELAPEQVNEGPATAPSKRIIQFFPQYDGLKASAGPIIAAEIGLQNLRDSCPHFGAWIDELTGAVT